MLELFGIRNLRGCKRRDNKVNSERKKQKATINIQELWQQETMTMTMTMTLLPGAGKLSS